MMKATTWDAVNRAIAKAADDGIIQDKRSGMPRGRSAGGNPLSWPRSRHSPADILGHCVHQNGSQNTDNPLATARYHTSRNNHIRRSGQPLPSCAYLIMVPDLPGPAWVVGDFDWITWAQGDEAAGDENRHLIPILVMGGFEESGWSPPWAKPAPSDHQMENLNKVTDWLQGLFGYSGEGFFGHYHFGKPACPGRMLRNWTETARAIDDHPELLTAREWQEALLRWHPHVLPRFGADGVWGEESQGALASFQRAHGMRATAFQDPFSELLLLQRYPAPVKFESGEYTEVPTGPGHSAADIGREDVVMEVGINSPVTFVDTTQAVMDALGGKPAVDHKTTTSTGKLSKKLQRRKAKQRAKQQSDSEDPPSE